ncbi:unnamed protein product, partial [Heterosigma akashiwo]
GGGGGAPLVVARSTNIRRTIQSAQSLLLGLYPLEARAPGALLLPVAVRPIEEEAMIPNADRSCRRQLELIRELDAAGNQLPRDLREATSKAASVRFSAWGRAGRWCGRRRGRCWSATTSTASRCPCPPGWTPGWWARCCGRRWRCGPAGSPTRSSTGWPWGPSWPSCWRPAPLF